MSRISRCFDSHGKMHLEYLPYSHSLLFGLGGAILVWALMRAFTRTRPVASAMGLLFASHVVLDVIQHEPNIRIVPWAAHPLLGLNLTAHPWWDFTIETALAIACWAYYRGSTKLLIGLVALNITNLPMMLASEGGSSPLAQNPYILPTVILVTIVLAWAVVGRYSRHAAPVAGTGDPMKSSDRIKDEVVPADRMSGQAFLTQPPALGMSGRRHPNLGAPALPRTTPDVTAFSRAAGMGWGAPHRFP